MNTDMNQYLIFSKCIGMHINYCKKNDSLEGSVASKHTQVESLVLGKLACHLCLQNTFIVYIYTAPARICTLLIVSRSPITWERKRAWSGKESPDQTFAHALDIAALNSFL